MRTYKPGQQYDRARLYDRRMTRKHWDAILVFPLKKTKLNTYCRMNSLYRQEMILSVIKHFPQEWEQHRDAVGPIAVGKCKHCGLEFYANNPRQGFCNRWCYRQYWRQANPGWRERTPSGVQRIASQDGTQDPTG